MPAPVAPPTSEAVGPADLAALRDRLAAAGFGDEVFRVTETIAPGLLDPLRLPLIRQALVARGDAASVLMLLLVYSTPVPADSLVAAIGDAPADALVRCGIVAPAGGHGGQAVPRLRVTPFGELLIAADLGDGGPDAVMAPGSTTALLANLLPVAFAGRVLDVGTGPGTLALLMAARGADAVGTDVSGRAVAFAEFNAALNGLAIDVRRGDLLEPVAGDEFALIVSQPPYVMRPEGVAPVTFMHGGANGDEIAMALAAVLPGALAPGGLAIVRFDMQLADGDTAAGRVRAVVDSAVSVAVFEQPGAGLHRQAVAYAALHDPTLGSAYADLATAYCAHFARIGARRTVGATVAVARPAAASAPRFTVGSTRSLAGWDELVQYLASVGAAVEDDGDVLARHVAVAAGCRLSVEREAAAGDGGDRRYFARFEPGAAMADVELAPMEAALLQRIGAGAVVTAVVDGFAAEVGADRASAAEPVLSFVRDGIARGLLVIVEP